MNSMVKNGLFLASIGCLMLLISANARTGEYNIYNLTTALFLIIVGSFMVFRAKRKIKKKKD